MLPLRRGVTVPELAVREGDRFPVGALGLEDAGRALVVWAYPKDSSSGCEREAHGFNLLLPEFTAAGVDVIGLSNGTEDTAREFASSCDLGFDLLPSDELVQELGLLHDFGEYGVMPARTTFLVDAAGIVRMVWDVTDVVNHPAEVLEAARSL
jgi:peroxiredoxin Q/BCP